MPPQLSSLGSQRYQPLFLDGEPVALGDRGDAQHGKGTVVWVVSLVTKEEYKVVWHASSSLTNLIGPEFLASNL